MTSSPPSPSPPSAPEPSARAVAAHLGAATPTTPGATVLDHVAARVQQRLDAEQSVTNRTGEGAHGASLIWPWPL
ncbi:HaaA family cyclophane-containing RiPP peptide [Streptomyces sp. NPDC047000]|uniref:HaaA family cyclophane-containing RiPP peptide n=1 Tax=Streptomyces sp. NPDC047000 TaxID=3155474 RepID=UPI0033D183E2